MLPSRVRNYRREWLDQLTFTGEFVWGRLWSRPKIEVLQEGEVPARGNYSLKLAPLNLLPREDLEMWSSITGMPDASVLSGPARIIYERLSTGGALFTQELAKLAGLLPMQIEEGLSELAARGFATSDSYAGLRMLLVAPSKRRYHVVHDRPQVQTSSLLNIAPAPAFIPGGRWSLFRFGVATLEKEDSFASHKPEQVEFVAKQLLRRYGIVFKKLLLRERIPVPWREVVRVLRYWELTGELRGGRFVSGFDGEQYALPQSVDQLRAIRRRAQPIREGETLQVSAADPLNLQGILTPGLRVASSVRTQVQVG